MDAPSGNGEARREHERSQRSPELFASLGWFKRWQKVFALTTVVVVAAAALWFGTHHPNYASPRGAAAQERIVQIFGEPASADGTLVGDYAIERFYALNREDGRIYIADLCKGRVKQLLESNRPDGTVSYSLNLERSNLSSTRIEHLAEKVMPPSDGAYLGLKVQGGTSEVFPLNYDGRLPPDREAFRSAKGEDMATYLRHFPKTYAVKSVTLFNIRGNNFALSSTDAYPYFTDLFGLKKSVILSHIVFVDDVESAPSQP